MRIVPVAAMLLAFATPVLASSLYPTPEEQQEANGNAGMLGYERTESNYQRAQQEYQQQTAPAGDNLGGTGLRMPNGGGLNAPQ
jgi:hypothetical protein